MKIEREWFKLGVVVLCVAWGVFLMFTLGVKFCGGSEEFGQMGDAFNMLNALFAGLAFAAICFQLWMQQQQIDEERKDRRRAERISALTTRIQTTFDKIVHERKLLLQVAPSFANVSFFHEGDGAKLAPSIDARGKLVISLQEAIEVRRKVSTWNQAVTPLHQDFKDLWDAKASLEMMEQIKNWVDLLEAWEKEVDELLANPQD